MGYKRPVESDASGVLRGKAASGVADADAMLIGVARILEFSDFGIAGWF